MEKKYADRNMDGFVLPTIYRTHQATRHPPICAEVQLAFTMPRRGGEKLGADVVTTSALILATPINALTLAGNLGQACWVAEINSCYHGCLHLEILLL